MKHKRLLLRLAQGHFQNVPFQEITALAQGFGFELVRVSGSHHIFSHPQVQEVLSLQAVRGEAKPYQIRQLLRLIERYNLHLEDEP
jgi:predicted RNA binding protein YcfA (HicA-like mRNA interferase family)